jgi:hypothetical protein
VSHNMMLVTLLLLKHTIVNIIIKLGGPYRSVIIHISFKICRVIFICHLRILNRLSRLNCKVRCRIRILLFVPSAIAVKDLLDSRLADGHLFLTVSIGDLLPGKREYFGLEGLIPIATS